ncbi:ABC transporter permease subunit [Pelagicoccus sp. SDUM812002]|uniref:ABC transporter permease subunit n=1 Tax=Pelagicoccus sp. SDUM812002 TaxID=3041266 RepID=UPI00280F48D0|nr:ABC transporter permease subunit [Pelagicoccus sp. SDUM812002]MDQ8184060.1 ABC transporter permease subunit [Pelagicoccus sp. SDUM812002]
MKHAWNAQYRRWEGKSVGVWQRRLSIARYGLRLCLSGKIIKIFLVLAFAQTFLLGGVFFLFGQLVAPESALLTWLEGLGGQEIIKIISALTSWALLYPEICVDGIYRVMYYLLTFSGPFLSMIIVALFVHRLIANDLASNAIVIYNSKALTRWDYLIGKFIVVSTILSVVWILPVITSWVLSNFLSPDWSFFYHSFPSLLRGLTVGLVAVFSLSCLALLVSSFARKTGAAVAYWILGWISLGIVASVASVAHPALDYISPIQAIYAFSGGVFKMLDLVTDAQNMLPFFGGFFNRVSAGNEPSDLPISNGEVFLPLLSLSLYCIISIVVVSRRVRSS